MGQERPLWKGNIWAKTWIQESRIQCSRNRECIKTLRQKCLKNRKKDSVLQWSEWEKALRDEARKAERDLDFNLSVIEIYISYFQSKVCLSLLWILPQIPALWQAHNKCAINRCSLIEQGSNCKPKPQNPMVENQAFQPGGGRRLERCSRAPGKHAVKWPRLQRPSFWFFFPFSEVLGIPPSLSL